MSLLFYTISGPAHARARLATGTGCPRISLSKSPLPPRPYLGPSPKFDLLLMYSASHLVKTLETLVQLDKRISASSHVAVLNPRAVMPLAGGVEMQCNRKLLLEGIELFGAPDQLDMQLLHLRLECLDTEACLLELQRNRLTPAHNRRLICTHELHFPLPVVLPEGAWYRITIQMEGPLPTYMCQLPEPYRISKNLKVHFRMPQTGVSALWLLLQWPVLCRAAPGFRSLILGRHETRGGWQLGAAKVAEVASSDNRSMRQPHF